MRISQRIAWNAAVVLAVVLADVSSTFTWEWATWWTAALLRFALTGESFTVTRNE